MEPKNKICLAFDYNHLAWRNFFTNRALATKSGVGTGVPFGILRSVKMMCDKFKPHRVIMCADKGKSWRKSVMPDYKSHRDEKDEKELKEREELYRQMEVSNSIMGSLGIPVISSDSMEADDLCALLAKVFRPDDEYVIVVSGDKDLLQLVSENTGYYHPSYSVLVAEDGWRAEKGIDQADFIRRFNRETSIHPESFTMRSEKLDEGIPQDRWILYRALVGDSADNLPGIPGIGPKMAQKAVLAADTPEGIVEAVENKTLKGAKFKNIDADELSFQRAMIDLDFVAEDEKVIEVIRERVEQSLSDPPEPNRELFEMFIKDLEFYSILQSVKAFVKNIPRANEKFNQIEE